MLWEISYHRKDDSLSVLWGNHAVSRCRVFLHASPANLPGPESLVDLRSKILECVFAGQTEFDSLASDTTRQLEGEPRDTLCKGA